MFRVLLLTLIISTLPVMAFAAPKLTIYDDGLSCPYDCDSHVVFHSTLNGTKYAHAPGSRPNNFDECVRNQSCEICFDNKGVDCLTTVYRGSGPGKNTFDLTPAFYQEWCAKTEIPQRLSQQCKELESNAKSLDNRINCIQNPTHNQCVGIMQKAVMDKRIDKPIYEQCLAQGEKVFNRGKPSYKKRRYNCAYEYESNGGPNSKGLRWKRLQPGACRDNTYVGRDGLDCCSGIKFVDAALRTECRIYYPKAKPL